MVLRDGDLVLYSLIKSVINVKFGAIAVKLQEVETG